MVISGQSQPKTTQLFVVVDEMCFVVCLSSAAGFGLVVCVLFAMCVCGVLFCHVYVCVCSFCQVFVCMCVCVCVQQQLQLKETLGKVAGR